MDNNHDFVRTLTCNPVITGEWYMVPCVYYKNPKNERISLFPVTSKTPASEKESDGISLNYGFRKEPDNHNHFHVDTRFIAFDACHGDSVNERILPEEFVISVFEQPMRCARKFSLPEKIERPITLAVVKNLIANNKTKILKGERCPHKGTLLVKREDGSFICPNHGVKFHCDGTINAE